MTTDMHASCGQERTIAGRSTGFRRMTLGLMVADNQARDFEGFGENGPRPVHILAAFKAAAPFLGYGAKVVHAVDWFFRFTQPKDWLDGSRPIVWPSARMQQDELQLSPTRTKALNRLLIELGLIAAKDSPNGKRYGRRDRDGRIVEAYGFDLSPLAQRYDEFLTVAEAGREIRARMGQLRRRATIARKGMAQIMEAVVENRLTDETWRQIESEAQLLSNALKRTERVDEMEIGVAGLERRQLEAQARLKAQLEAAQPTSSEAAQSSSKDVDIGRVGSDFGPHIYTYKPTLNPKQDTVIASEGSSSELGARPSHKTGPHKPGEREERGQVMRLRPDELAMLAPRLRAYLRSGDPTWAEIVDAADILRQDLDISRPLWVAACETLGRNLAAVTVAVVSTKNPEHFTRTTGHYFHGMIERAKKGQLHLERTIWGLRTSGRKSGAEGRA